MNKLLISVRYYLIGAKYFTALKAMEFASQFHKGTRKDGKTPEFNHQLEIFSYLRTMETSLSNPELVYISIFLHDTPEDYDISFQEIENKFGTDTVKCVRLVTKKHRGISVPEQMYYDQISEDSNASVLKGGDRIHNVSSMVGVFSPEKQMAYVKETEDFVLPMLKKARRNFPEQELVYENEKLMLKNQILLIRKINSKEI